MMRKFYSVSRSQIDENNDAVSKSWNVYCHGIVAKLTSATVFTAAEDLAFLFWLCLGVRKSDSQYEEN